MSLMYPDTNKQDKEVRTAFVIRSADDTQYY